MQHVANYTVIRDVWMLECDQNRVEFSVPNSLNRLWPAVLTFMLNVDNLEDTSIALVLNDYRVWDWTFEAGRRTMFFQEVINPGRLQVGDNVLRFESSSKGARVVQLSDIVVWWQSNI